MAIEDGFSVIDDVPNVGQIQDYVISFLWRLLVLVVASIWIVFWGLVTRLHVVMGDIASAVVVGVLFVLPALIGLGVYLRDSLTRDLRVDRF